MWEKYNVKVNKWFKARSSIEGIRGRNKGHNEGTIDVTIIPPEID